MTTVGFIGSGNIGSTVARLAIAAGHDVVLSNSRDPGTLAGLVTELGPKARAATPAEAAQAGELVVVTVPLHAYRAVPVAPLAGKTVLDTNNYYPERDGRVAALDDGTATTSGLLQEHLVGARVVKAFNNIYYVDLAAQARPKGAADRSALPVAADDPRAKAAAVEFLDAVGYDAVDAGPLAESWRQERDTPVYVQPYRAAVAPAARIAALLDEAKRG
jgi:8-hydroxy-5-deazaflavin:NADPH oxidoreductase